MSCLIITRRAICNIHCGDLGDGYLGDKYLSNEYLDEYFSGGIISDDCLSGGYIRCFYFGSWP